ncbi:hypothetical protein ABZ477_04755 [Microbacterium sp. NPDC019599]|uniref:hypothetical protein n=1 Tax=Microbacterium sp. NPDC019599 TaxID=3154690 RepID=UPI0033F4BB1D
MTTEIAILNRSAVALAADSAVSVSSAGSLKVYDGVNKLFELIKGRPVGVMIYNGAELSFRPWETIIKAYREERRDRSLPTLDEYVEDFKAFIRLHPELFSERQQHEALMQTAFAHLSSVRVAVLQDLQQAIAKGKRPTPRLITATTARHVRVFWDRARTTYDITAWPDALPTARTLGQQLRADLDPLIDAAFGNLPLSDPLKANLRVGLIHRMFGRNDADGQFSGVVIAGFGDAEYYPRLREFRAKAVYKDRLMAFDVLESKTDIGVYLPGDIKSFAQGDMIRSFTDGIQDQVRGEMIEFWNNWRTRDVGNAVAADARLDGLAPADRAAVTDSIRDMSSTAVDEFLDHMAKYEQASVKGPLLQSVAFLPKDELGAMAESLVNLTTLKRRVSINEAQTVGGAVDVAVVSRGDGFVWLKRKHYFDQELNPSWAATHAAQPVRRKASQ